MTASRIWIYSTLALVALSGVAIAATDPVVTAQGATDAGFGLVATYGPLWGGMALVFGLVSTLLERNKSVHWIAQGRTLAVIVAAVGVAGAALTAHFSGAPWSGVAITAVMALFKLIEPTTIPASTNPVKFPVSLSLVLLLGIALAGAGCGVPATAGHAIVDCTRADASALEAAAVRLLRAPSWAALESEAIAAGETIGGCALLAVIDKYRAPQSLAAAPNPHDVIERVRAHFGGVTWQTAGGPR